MRRRAEEEKQKKEEDNKEKKEMKEEKEMKEAKLAKTELWCYETVRKTRTKSNLAKIVSKVLFIGY